MNTLKTSIAVITLVLASASGQARAQFLDGNKLAEELRKSERTTDATYYEGRYTGYVMGVADAFLDVSWCPPASVTEGQK
jgi:hypothetical protein